MERQNPPKLQRRLAAVLFADVQGYSSKMEADEDSAHLETTACMELFRAKISGYDGRFVRILGDGVLVEMQSALDAVKFVVEMQRALAERNLEVPVDKRVEFRMGVNLGDVIPEADDIYGETVNIAKRLQDLAYPGGICITKAVYEQVKTKLGYGYEYMGSQDLKNIVQPVEAYRVRPDRNAMVSLPTIRKEDKPPQMPDKPSIAVLPLKNLSERQQEYYISDGITEDVSRSLTRFRELFVISRHSAAVYKLREKVLADVAHELGVRYLMDGTVRREGNRLHVTIQLIDAVSGQEIWGERFNRPFGEILSMLDDLTSSIAATIARQIDAQERKRALRANTEDLEAYSLVMRGQELLFLHEKQSNEMARKHYKRAVQIDPGYARAYAAMSRTLNYDWRYSWGENSSRLLDQALDLAQEATRHDEFDARGYAELGFVHLYKKNHEASIAAYERALNLNPNDADLLAEMADALSHCRRSDESVKLLENAMRLNPYYPDWYLWNLAGAFYELHRYEDSIAAIKKMHNPMEGRRILAASYAQLGELTEARHQAAEVMTAHPEFSLTHWAEVQPNQSPDDLKHFIDGLRKAGLK